MSAEKPIILRPPNHAHLAKDAFIATIQQVLNDTPEALFAVLVGSRANGSATDKSDWDIAIQWQYGDALQRIAGHESMRHRLARVLDVADDQIDLIDLSNARLAMRALIAEEGLLLVVNDEHAWTKFLTRTWRELEDFYWDRAHAA